MILYIAGPMSGLPDSNYPAFNAAAAALRAAGHTVLNPAENPPPANAANMTRDEVWQYYMRLSVRQIADADCVVMLKGYQQSKGAKIEERLAHDLKLSVHYPAYNFFSEQLKWFCGDLSAGFLP